MSACQCPLFAEPLEPTETRSAVIVGPYRYVLERDWSGGRTVVWIMLNPSTADASTDDPTLRRCLAFSKAWGFGTLRIVNLFAWRSPDPADLERVVDPIGPDNDHHIHETARAGDLVVCAWGVGGKLFDRDQAVLAQLRRAGVELHALAWTQRGKPTHPLYLSKDIHPKPWRPTSPTPTRRPR